MNLLNWSSKFAHAFRGMAVGVREQNSFLVRVPVALAVVIAGWLLGVSRIEWCLLVLCIGTVMAAELFNTALEKLARAITPDEDANIRDALDAGSAAVLVVSVGGVVVGLIVLGQHVIGLIGT